MVLYKSNELIFVQKICSVNLLSPHDDLNERMKLGTFPFLIHVEGEATNKRVKERQGDKTTVRKAIKI